MKKVILLSIVLLFSIPLRSQQSESLMNRLLGKWNWLSSEDGWGHYYTPEIAGYTRSINFYQDLIDSGTNSLCYVTYRNDTIIASGKTNIGILYENGGEIYSNVILEDTFYYNMCNCFYFHTLNTSLSFSLCMTDYFNHIYKKDTLYNNVYDVTNNLIYNVYPNPSNGIFEIKCSNKTKAIEIYKLTGELLYSKYKLNGQTSMKIDLTDFQKGIYLARIVDFNDFVVQKIILK